ncbi:MAG: gliding motility-associated C-terminal domain-containing protein [Bacteroidia bacterium]|nr:gliding motility-associated C-terminal domain-containing protein [Bacteroidia bacterium]
MIKRIPMSLRMGFLFIAGTCATVMSGFSQFISNPSFEGSIGMSHVPPGWEGCHPLSTPDTQPGAWQCVLSPINGQSYLSLVTRGPLGSNAYTTEDIQTNLLQTLLTNQCYSFKIDLAMSETFNHDSWDGMIYYNNPVSLTVWGGSNSCDTTVLLAHIDSIDHTYWRTYEFTFFPDYNIHFLMLRANYTHLPEYFGNVLLDNIRLINYLSGELVVMDTIVNYGTPVVLAAPAADSYEWTPATGISCTDCQFPIATPPYPITYSVFVTQAVVCTHTEKFIIKLLPFIPNVITPNGDSYNDSFVIDGLEENSKLIITDRWGKTVFETDAYDNSWDGTFEGNLLLPDTYWYVLRSPSLENPLKGFLVVMY